MTMGFSRVVEMEDQESIKSFVESTRRKDAEKFDKIEDMRRALERLNNPETENKIFQISWTSNW